MQMQTRRSLAAVYRLFGQTQAVGRQGVIVFRHVGRRRCSSRGTVWPGEGSLSSITPAKRDAVEHRCSPRTGCRSSSPGQRPEGWDRKHTVFGRSNGPTIHRDFGERLARWTDFASWCPYPQGWENEGPSAQTQLNSTVLRLNGLAAIVRQFFRQHTPPYWATPPHYYRKIALTQRGESGRLPIWTGASVHFVLSNDPDGHILVNGRNGCCSEDPGKRQAILDEAIRAFAELGFRRADVQVIADRAGVGKGTVYRYFRSKEDLFWATTLEVLVRMEQHIFSAIEGMEGACAKLRAAAIAHASFFEVNPHYHQLCIQERAEFQGSGPQSHHEQHEKMLQRMSVILGEGIESGELRPIDTRQTTLAIGCLLFGTVMLAGHVGSMDLMKMTEYAIDIFIRGIHKDGLTETEPYCLTETQI